MIFNSISVLSIVAALSLNAPFASAFSPSPGATSSSTIWSTKQLVSNFGLNAENKEDSNEYGGSSRRDLFKSLPTTAAALTAVLGGAASVPKAEAALTCGTLDERTKGIIGPLAELVGKWEGKKGFVMIAMPGPGSIPTSTGDFIIRKFPYRETFEVCPLVSGFALNRGGSIDQAGGVCTYTKTVWALNDQGEDDKIIHEENGMFFRLDNIAKNPGEPDTGVDVPNRNPVPVGPGNQAPFAIGRSAIIPHGNTAMIFGDVKSASGPPIIPDISTLPFTKPRTRFPRGYNDPYISPPSVDAAPTKTLKDALNNGPAVSNTVHFSLDSKNGPGGVLNSDFIEKRADTKDFKADFWVEDLGNGKKQLQYAESATIFFHFNIKFLFLPAEIAWPHVMVNTLTKVA